MCWEINKKEFYNKPEKYHKMAEEDIIVYKIGCCTDNEFIPYYYKGFSYRANIPNKDIKLHMESNQLYKSYAFIDEGYHSYLGECFLELFNKDAQFVGVFSLGSVLKKPKVKKKNILYLDNTYFIHEHIDDSFIIGKFIIPKGTEYYINERNEIVSSQLVWTGEAKHVSDIKLGNFIKLKLKDIDYVLENRKT